jgi:hypothetical protein
MAKLVRAGVQASQARLLILGLESAQAEAFVPGERVVVLDAEAHARLQALESLAQAVLARKTGGELSRMAKRALPAS